MIGMIRRLASRFVVRTMDECVALGVVLADVVVDGLSRLGAAVDLPLLRDCSTALIVRSTVPRLMTLGVAMLVGGGFPRSLLGSFQVFENLVWASCSFQRRPRGQSVRWAVHCLDDFVDVVELFVRLIADVDGLGQPS